jgi:outer membrane biosynthesis protein TonB
VIEVNNTVLGLVAAAVPLLIIGFFILRRLPWIFAFFVALLAVGLGYLETTGAIREFGHNVRAVLPEGIVKHKAHEAEPAAAPAAETPADGPAMAPASPPAEPATPAPEATPAPAQEPAAPAPETTPAPEATPPAEPAPAQPQPSTP